MASLLVANAFEWEDTPVDVFLSNHPFHDRAAGNRRTVTFAGVDQLLVLACADLAVFKAFYAAALLGLGDDRAAFFGRVAEAISRT